MPSAELQYIANDAGERTAVIVPIDLWREIESERETAYLLSSDAMRERLLGALGRTGGVPLDEVAERLGLCEASN